MQTERDFICQVIYQRTSTYTATYIAMKEFPGNDLPSLDLAKRDYISFATVLLSALGVTARNSDTECAVLWFPININLASRSLARNVECNHQWCQVLNNKNNSTPVHLNENGIDQTHFSSGREKCGLGTRLPFQIPGFCFFVVQHYKWSQWENWGIFNWSSIQFYIMPLNHCNCTSKHFCCIIASIWKWKCKIIKTGINILLQMSFSLTPALTVT